MGRARTRNHNIDILKLLCAFLVVIIHTPIFAKVEIFRPIARCAVPCFFIISGFFIFNPDKEKMSAGLKRSIKHILYILLWSNLFFIILELILGNYRPPQFINLVVFNRTRGLGKHLWYLFAYLYVLGTVYLFHSKDKLKWLTSATPILLIICLVLGSYSHLFFGVHIPMYYTRNFLFTGIPFFVIGMYIRQLKEISAIKNISLYSLLAFVAFSGVAILENLYLDYPPQDMFIGTIFAAISLFIVFATSSRSQSNRLSTWGERDSLYIYIFHTIALIPQLHMGNLLGAWGNIAYDYAGAIIVFLVILAGIELTRWVWTKIFERHHV